MHAIMLSPGDRWRTAAAPRRDDDAETHGANTVAIVFCRVKTTTPAWELIEIDFLEHCQAILIIRHAQVEGG